MIALRAIAPALATLAIVCAPARAALDDDAVRARAREVLRDPDLQTRRPDGVGEPAPPPPRDDDEDERRRTSRSESYSPPVQAPSAISQALIWIVVGAIGVAIVVLLASQLARARRQRKLERQRAPRVGEPDADLLPIDAERLDETLQRALRLAEQGHFEEAVHVLLAGAIADLQARAGLTTEVALTSRELLAAAHVPRDPRAAFEALVMAVEVSLFGGLVVTRDDFERCALSFRSLRHAVVA